MTAYNMIACLETSAEGQLFAVKVSVQVPPVLRIRLPKLDIIAGDLNLFRFIRLTPDVFHVSGNHNRFALRTICINSACCNLIFFAVAARKHDRSGGNALFYRFGNDGFIRGIIQCYGKFDRSIVNSRVCPREIDDACSPGKHTVARRSSFRICFQIRNLFTIIVGSNCRGAAAAVFSDCDKLKFYIVLLVFKRFDVVNAVIVCANHDLFAVRQRCINLVLINIIKAVEIPCCDHVVRRIRIAYRKVCRLCRRMARTVSQADLADVHLIIFNRNLLFRIERQTNCRNLLARVFGQVNGSGLPSVGLGPCARDCDVLNLFRRIFEDQSELHFRAVRCRRFLISDLHFRGCRNVKLRFVEPYKIFCFQIARNNQRAAAVICADLCIIKRASIVFLTIVEVKA